MFDIERVKVYFVPRPENMRKLLYVLIPFFFVACAEPFGPSATQDPRHAKVQRLETEESVVIFNYLGDEGSMMVFDVEIRNTSLDPIHIDPAHIHYAGYEKSNSLYSIAPLDPNPLTAYDVGLRLRSKIRSRETLKVLVSALSSGLQALGGTPWLEGALPALAANRSILTTGVSFAEDFAVGAIDSKNEQLEGDIAYVPAEILEASMIHPGHRLQGKLFFDVIPRMRYYDIELIVGRDQYVFQFRK